MTAGDPISDANEYYAVSSILVQPPTQNSGPKWHSIQICTYTSSQ